MLPGRVPRQIEPLFTQAGADGSALLYGTPGGGSGASYTEFNHALEHAIRQYPGPDAGAEPELVNAHDESHGTVAGGPKWIKPQPPAKRNQKPVSVPQQRRHKQLKPAVQ